MMHGLLEGQSLEVAGTPPPIATLPRTPAQGCGQHTRELQAVVRQDELGRCHHKPKAGPSAKTQRQADDNFINGLIVPPRKGQYFDVITPITGKLYTQAARSGAEDIEAALDAAHTAAPKWAAVPAAERANLLLKIADLLPPGVVDVVNGYGREAGMPLASSKRIAKIAFGRVLATPAARPLIDGLRAAHAAIDFCQSQREYLAGLQITLDLAPGYSGTFSAETVRAGTAW